MMHWEMALLVLLLTVITLFTSRLSYIKGYKKGVKVALSEFQKIWIDADFLEPDPQSSKKNVNKV